MQNMKTNIRRRWTSKSTRTERSSNSPEIASGLLGANQVHDALCAPPVQRIDGFEIATSIIPARYVSGDFVLSFKEQGSWYFVLGDLMGKGLAAAMWLTHVVDLIRRECERNDDLSVIMGRLNYEMYRSRVGVPLTSLFMARLNEGESRIVYSCGGCPAGFLLASDGTVTMLDRGGPVLGALEKASYGSASFELSPGQVMVAVSDGVTEVHHGADFELRPDRVANHLQFTAGSSAESLVRSLTTKVRGHAPVISDDISVMAIQRTF